MRLSRMRPGRRTCMTLGVMGLAAVLGLAAAVKYVNVERLDIVDKPRSVAKTVVTVDRNTALNVLSAEGRFYKVEVAGKEGYVAVKAIADSPGQAMGKGVKFGAIQGGAVPGLDSANAVKGVGPGAQQYASANGHNTSGLQELIRRRDAITPAEFDQFLTAGGLRSAAADSIDEKTVLASKGGQR